MRYLLDTNGVGNYRVHVNRLNEQYFFDVPPEH